MVLKYTSWTCEGHLKWGYAARLKLLKEYSNLSFVEHVRYGKKGKEVSVSTYQKYPFVVTKEADSD